MTFEVTAIDDSNINYFFPFLGRSPFPDEGAVGLIANNKAAGAGIFYVRENTCIIRHLFIAPSFRRYGGATTLFNSVKDLLFENGIRNFLIYYKESNELTCFLRSNSFDCMSSSPLYSFSSSDLLSTDIASRVDVGMSKRVKRFTDISSEQKSAIADLISKKSFDRCLLNPGAYDPHLSIAVINKGKAKALLLQKKEDDDFYVSLLMHDGTDSALIIPLIRAFCVILSEKAKPESRVIFAGIYVKLVDKLRMLLPHEKGLYVDLHAWTGILRVSNFSETT